jgi:hypothetical protein
MAVGSGKRQNNQSMVIEDRASTHKNATSFLRECNGLAISFFPPKDHASHQLCGNYYTYGAFKRLYSKPLNFGLC